MKLVLTTKYNIQIWTEPQLQLLRQLQQQPLVEPPLEEQQLQQELRQHWLEFTQLQEAARTAGVNFKKARPF